MRNLQNTNNILNKTSDFGGNIQTHEKKTWQSQLEIFLDLEVVSGADGWTDLPVAIRLEAVTAHAGPFGMGKKSI